MSEKISKINVDGVVYDIASTGDIQEQLSALENKVTEEASAREEGDAKLSEKIESEASRVDGMVNQINENVASSIETLNNNLVQAIETIALVKKDDLTYELQVGDKIAGTINIPADQFLKSVEYSAEDKSLTFVFNTSEGEQTSVVDLSSLVDTYVAGNGIELIENGFSIKLDPSSESYLSVSEAGIKVEGINEIKKNVQEVAANLVTVNENLASIDAINKKAVKYEDVADSNLPERKAIVLKNGDVILGGNLEGGTSSLVQLNRWGVADFGSSSVPFNINTPKDVRPTVQEAGQLREEAHKIAYVSDVAGLSNTLEALNATVQILQSKVEFLTKTNTEVVSVDGSAGELKDSSKDYIVSGSINENAEIVGKSISLKSIKVSDNARLKLNAGDVEAKDLNISGSFPKANGNTVISVNNAEFIVFKDMVFDASEVYNGIEIGLASNSVLPKNILFDNCKFQGEFSNNAILVFGTQDNAIITLNNCYFEKISNALRLSNKSNASGVVVNINNCTVDQWETRAPWQGFLICEDYTNKTEEEVNANNLFGDGKITVNFNNLVHAGVKINPADPASVCGTKNESQVVMVCQDAVAGPEGDYCLSYDAAKFPVVSFK